MLDSPPVRSSKSKMRRVTIMRKCNVCLNVLPFEQFHANSALCKACKSAKDKARVRNPRKPKAERMLAAEARKLKWQADHPDPLKARARQQVTKAIAQGVLIVPDECQGCGKSKTRHDGVRAVQAHHHLGYDRPLEVEWLCPKCRRERERRGRPTTKGLLATCEQVRAVYDYDPVNGRLIYRMRRAACRAGTVAGTFDSNGQYRKIYFMGRFYGEHRLIWLHVKGEFPVKLLDHINRNPSDNRIENLREATLSENQQNVDQIARNKSGHRGVHLLKPANKWVARLTVNRKVMQFPPRDTIEEAINDRKEAVRRYHPFAPQESA